MNVLYINSGYKGIYSYFDLWIKELNSEQINIIDIPVNINLNILKNTLLTIELSFVLIMIGNKNPNQLLKIIKETNVPIISWFTEDPFYNDVSLEVLPYSDYILSIDKSSCDFYSKLGYQNIHYFPLATNEHVFKSINIEKDIDLLLVGYPYPNRIKLIQSIINSTNFSIVLIGKNWEKHLRIPNHKKRKIQFINYWIPPNEVNIWYNKAKIILNPHRESTFHWNKNSNNVLNRSVNNRFFDIALSGGFQLINDEIDIFIDEKIEKLIRYSDENSCINLIKKYINTPSYRQDIINALLLKIKGKNTFSNRIDNLFKIIEEKTK
ncbi:CgeB family protein [Gottfriedia acidiceleris]|uniref:CgeB family protein n=1 Tax=Gottfriedia acidiceleris TaxID=371036 RepID=UPI00101C73A0|nr:DUF3880 domain-containing protein [Gottfriedia acidiceleris]